MNLSMRFYKRSNGYYYYEIVRHHPVSLRTRDYKEARALYKIVKQEYLKGRIIQLDGDNRITLEEFKEKFFTEHTDIADDTKAAYDLAVRLLMDSLSGSMLLSTMLSA